MKRCSASLAIQSVSSVAQLCLTLQPHESQACQASPSITNSRSLFKLMSIELVMPSSHLILCHPLLLLLPIPPSIRVFSNESTLCMRWPKYWSFSFSISPSNEHPGLISFRMDWLDLLAVQGTLRVFSNTTVQEKYKLKPQGDTILHLLLKKNTHRKLISVDKKVEKLEPL